MRRLPLPALPQTLEPTIFCGQISNLLLESEHDHLHPAPLLGTHLPRPLPKPIFLDPPPQNLILIPIDPHSLPHLLHLPPHLTNLHPHLGILPAQHPPLTLQHPHLLPILIILQIPQILFRVDLKQFLLHRHHLILFRLEFLLVVPFELVELLTEGEDLRGEVLLFLEEFLEEGVAGRELLL